ncbi:MAG: hypothetical protein WDW36_008335 [Sanguina aurantia]
MSELEGLEDVSTSEAFKVLDSLFDAGIIPVDRADISKRRFSALHSALVRSMAREKQMLAEAKGLKRRMEEDAAEAAAAGAMSRMPTAAETDHILEVLREDVETALTGAAMAQERQALLQLEVNDLTHQRGDLTLRCQQLALEHAAALHPINARLRVEVDTLRGEAEEERDKVANAVREMEEARMRMMQIASEMVRLTAERAAEKSTMSKVDSLPEKARRQVDAVQTNLKAIGGQMETSAVRLSECESMLKMHADKEREHQEEHSRMGNQLERGRIQVEAKDRHADDIRKDVELAGVEADKILADQVDLDLKLRNQDAEIKFERDALARRQREKELLMRQYKGTEATLKDLRELIPNMKYQTEQMQRDMGVVEGRLRSQRKDLEEVKRELDIHMSDFLQEESLGKELVGLFQLTHREVALLEGGLVGLKHEEGERRKLMLELGSQRDRVALSNAQKSEKIKEVQQTEAIKEVELIELHKSQKDGNRRIRDFEKLYDLVKNQRNKFVNLIQTANQSITEMRDKLKILGNELDILHHEVFSKDRLLGHSRAQHTAAVQERDMLRSELGKLAASFRDRRRLVDEQINEVDQLNAIINAAEKALLRLKKQYEVAIEARNYTGIMLIDRNDELCILYEKCNIQDEVIKGGTLEMKQRDDEARMLELEVGSLWRSIQLTQRVTPQIPLLDNDVARLQRALLETRCECERLTASLEDPGNSSRWRLLEGKIPDPGELGARIQRLEERLKDKREQLLEKELILDEITSLSDKLRAQASEGRADTLELAKSVNEHQSKLRAVTRKMIATISELSMYQASSLKLGVERSDLEAEAGAARQRVEDGMFPNEEAEREWCRMERERCIIGELALTRAAVAAGQEQHTAEVQSTAEARPNAYIPEALGIPKPYGAFLPFKPTDAGSTMRHTRKPQPKEVVI